MLKRLKKKKNFYVIFFFYCVRRSMPSTPGTQAVDSVHMGQASSVEVTVTDIQQSSPEAGGASCLEGHGLRESGLPNTSQTSAGTVSVTATRQGLTGEDRASSLEGHGLRGSGLPNTSQTSAGTVSVTATRQGLTGEDRASSLEGHGLRGSGLPNTSHTSAGTVTVTAMRQGLTGEGRASSLEGHGLRGSGLPNTSHTYAGTVTVTATRQGLTGEDRASSSERHSLEGPRLQTIIPDGLEHSELQNFRTDGLPSLELHHGSSPNVFRRSSVYSGTSRLRVAQLRDFPFESFDRSPLEVASYPHPSCASDDSEEEDTAKEGDEDENSAAMNGDDEDTSLETENGPSDVTQPYDSLQQRLHQRKTKRRHPHTKTVFFRNELEASLSTESVIYHAAPRRKSHFLQTQRRHLPGSLSPVGGIGEQLESYKPSSNRNFPPDDSRRCMFEKPPHVTTFHQYYFRPVVHCCPPTKTWCTASPERGEFKFLRNARYLDKMVRDYGLGDFVLQNQGKKPQHFESNLLLNMQRGLEQGRRLVGKANGVSFETDKRGKRHADIMPGRGIRAESFLSFSESSEYIRDPHTLNSFSSVETNSTTDLQRNPTSSVHLPRNIFQVIAIYLRFLVAFFRKCLLCQSAQSETSRWSCPGNCCRLEKETDILRAGQERSKSPQSLNFLPTQPCDFAKTQLGDLREMETIHCASCNLKETAEDQTHNPVRKSFDILNGSDLKRSAVPSSESGRHEKILAEEDTLKDKLEAADKFRSKSRTSLSRQFGSALKQSTGGSANPRRGLETKIDHNQSALLRTQSRQSLASQPSDFEKSSADTSASSGAEKINKLKRDGRSMVVPPSKTFAMPRHPRLEYWVSVVQEGCLTLILIDHCLL